MDKVPIQSSDVIAMDNVAFGIYGLRIVFVNVFGIRSEDRGWVLIDAGISPSADYIRRWAVDHFGLGIGPKCIVLTHGHFDHCGGAESLAEHWDCPIYVHPLEMKYVTGKAEYPKPDPSVGGGLMSVLSPMFPRGPINIGKRVAELPSDGSVPGLAGWRWLHTPGHTEGHVSLIRDNDHVLIVGDAFCTTKAESFVDAAFTQPAELHGPPAYYTSDWDQARESVKKLATLKPLVLAPGHGRPMAGADVSIALDQLARDFDHIARPEHGRYAQQDRPAA